MNTIKRFPQDFPQFKASQRLHGIDEPPIPRQKNTLRARTAGRLAAAGLVLVAVGLTVDSQTDGGLIKSSAQKFDESKVHIAGKGGAHTSFAEENFTVTTPQDSKQLRTDPKLLASVPAAENKSLLGLFPVDDVTIADGPRRVEVDGSGSDVNDEVCNFVDVETTLTDTRTVKAWSPSTTNAGRPIASELEVMDNGNFIAFCMPRANLQKTPNGIVIVFDIVNDTPSDSDLFGARPLPDEREI